MPQHQVIALEEQGWRALSSSGAEARDFYERVLDHRVLMLLPGGLMLDERAKVIDSMSGQPWSSYKLQQVQAFQPTENDGRELRSRG